MAKHLVITFVGSDDYVAIPYDEHVNPQPVEVKIVDTDNVESGLYPDIYTAALDASAEDLTHELLDRVVEALRGVIAS